MLHGLLCLPGVARLTRVLLPVALPGIPKGLAFHWRHVFLHVLRIALLTPLLLVGKNIGLFVGSLVDGGRSVAPVFLTVVALSVSLPAIALIAVIVVIVRGLLAVGILPLGGTGTLLRAVCGPGGAAGMRVAVEIGVLLPVAARAAKLGAT